jgi:hypothetical protein
MELISGCVGEAGRGDTHISGNKLHDQINTAETGWKCKSAIIMS